MFRKHTFAVFFLVAASLLIFKASAQPRLWVESPNISIGTGYMGATLKSSFQIRNTGIKPLRILSVHASCGCTTVKPPKDSLNPNETDEIEILFNTHGYYGKVMKSVTIETNDPIAPATTIMLHADIISEFEPITKSFNLSIGVLKVARETTFTVTMKNISGKTIKVLGASSSVPDLKVSAEERKVQPAETIDIMVSIKPPRATWYSGDIFLNTGSSKQAQIGMRIAYQAVH